MQKYKVNDEVIVLSGKSKGKRGLIVKIFKKRNRIVVKGVNTIKKTVKPTQDNPTGGIVEKEGTLHLSNVSLVSEKKDKASRVHIKNIDGKNARVLTACKTAIPERLKK